MVVFVQHIKSEKLEISDHNVVEIMIPNCELTRCIDASPPADKVNLEGFNALNLFKGNFTAIAESLGEVDWDTLWCFSFLEEFPHILSATVLQACLQTVLSLKEHKEIW